MTVIAKYLQRETSVADLLYVTCFCDLYVWILIKYQLRFDFLVVFTLYQGLVNSSTMNHYYSTCIFVFSKPLCSHFAVQIVIREFSALLQQRCLSLSKGFPLQPKFATAVASAFAALL